MGPPCFCSDPSPADLFLSGRVCTGRPACQVDVLLKVRSQGKFFISPLGPQEFLAHLHTSPHLRCNLPQLWLREADAGMQTLRKRNEGHFIRAGSVRAQCTKAAFLPWRRQSHPVRARESCCNGILYLTRAKEARLPVCEDGCLCFCFHMSFGTFRLSPCI